MATKDDIWPPGLLDRDNQEILVARLYVKIDYLKQARLRIPVFAAIANFGLVTLSTHEVFGKISALIFICGFLFIGLVSAIALHVVKTSFDENIGRLTTIYEIRDIPASFAEPAFAIWFLLYTLVSIACVLPIALVWASQFI